MTDHFDAFSRLLEQRHSCRAFRPDPVDRDAVEQIVAAARRVPSWCNAQPWQLIVTAPNETDRFRTAMLEAAENKTPTPDIAWPERYSGVYLERRRACGFQLYDAVGITRNDRDARRRPMLENERLFGAPHVAIVTSESERGPYGAMDCGGFIAAFTLAATALGIASIPQAAIAGYSTVVHDFFDIPPNRQVLCAISFGYADTGAAANQFRTERAEVADILDWRGTG